MGHSVPKQYQLLLGKPVLHWSLDVFAADADCAGIMVAHAVDDHRVSSVVERPKVHLCLGGDTRRDSVLNALRRLEQSQVAADEWVFVHDAARPGITLAVLERLKRALLDPEVDGVIAALAVADTIKTHDAAGYVRTTLDRAQLLRAQTPQVFRLGALAEALALHPQVTDEASAMEQVGARLRWVEGSQRNHKLTTSEDWMAVTAALEERSS